MMHNKWYMHSPVLISVTLTPIFTKMTTSDNSIPGTSFRTMQVDVKKVNESLVKAFLLSKYPSFSDRIFSTK